MLLTQYAVSVWLSGHTDEKALQDYLSNGFAAASGLAELDTDFIEALCYTPPLHLFDIIDKVSYGKYFRSECVKMLYPQQFSAYSAAIFVYGRKSLHSTVNATVFAPVRFITLPGELFYAGTIPFEIPEAEK